MRCCSGQTGRSVVREGVARAVEALNPPPKVPIQRMPARSSKTATTQLALRLSGLRVVPVVDKRFRLAVESLEAFAVPIQIDSARSP